MSESEAEDDEDSHVKLPQKISARGNVQDGQSAIRLSELGPRMTLQVTLTVSLVWKSLLVMVNLYCLQWYYGRFASRIIWFFTIRNGKCSQWLCKQYCHCVLVVHKWYYWQELRSLIIIGLSALKKVLYTCFFKCHKRDPPWLSSSSSSSCFTKEKLKHPHSWAPLRCL